ncbi:alpha-1-antitrypsin-like [Anomaloglossus baeobatrachus]|uniref:alpha-1-antitrypsin-like n=1 Tax=Anomaloglossus baeobatrachus TaxID=238106 RepID=UPI003F503619
MKVFLFLGVTLLFKLALADHHEKDQKYDNDHNDRKDSLHKKEEHHSNEHNHHHNESMPCHKIAPYNSKFSFDLYRQVALDHPYENIVFSPVSVSTAFAFLSLGAKAQTRSQIIEGIGFNTSEISEQEMHEGFHQLLVFLNDVDRELQLSGGNALFISQEHKTLQTFLDEAKKLYQSEAFSTDFKNNEEAKNQINSYVEKKTHGKIAHMLDSVDQDIVLVLINYIYFKGKWEKPFSEEMTIEMDFHVNAKTTVKVPFMRRTGMYKVAFTKEAIVVSIPYEGDADALFILPKKGKLPKIEQNFNEETIKKWKKSMEMQCVEIFLPKFNISGNINLKETLSKMGIVDVFSDNADLSGITGEAKLKVSKAFHKAVLTIDEKGTEAGGSTALEATPRSTPNVIFNNHFIFSLYDYKTKSVLFSGRVFNPQK